MRLNLVINTKRRWLNLAFGGSLELLVGLARFVVVLHVVERLELGQSDNVVPLTARVVEGPAGGTGQDVGFAVLLFCCCQSLKIQLYRTTRDGPFGSTTLRLCRRRGWAGY